jgi:hypothetical protein
MLTCMNSEVLGLIKKTFKNNYMPKEKLSFKINKMLTLFQVVNFLTHKLSKLCIN